MIRITDAAQREALVAGLHAAAVQTYEVEPALLPRLLSLPWTTIGGDGVASCDVPYNLTWNERELGEPIGSPIAWRGGYGYGSVSTTAEERPADADGAIRFAEEALKFVQAEVDAKRVEHQAAQAARESERRAKAAAW
ncbi:MAG: hypothetical protein Q7S02_03865, partial [bacterium]|nr:hypothetical protein [bacterium]